jgi:uncharacterized membrane protein YkgB
MTVTVPGQQARPAISIADRILPIARGTALVGVILPLLLIGILKFTTVEIDGLEPLISGTPWLAWLYSAFGKAGASHFLGVVEITTAVLFMFSPWIPRAGIVGGALGTLTFLLTSSILLALPIWEPKSGGFPWLNDIGAFLIKDVALLGISMIIFAESKQRAAGARSPSS